MLTEVTVRVGKVEDTSDNDTASRLPSGPRIKRLVVGLEAPARLSHLSFQNYYTASLRIDQVAAGGGTVTLLETYPLMVNVHFEDDAQNWHVIKKEQLHGLDTTRATSFVFYLNQPSPLWDKWELRQLRFFETIEAPSVVPKAIADKVHEPNDGHLFRKYTINTSGTVSSDAKQIRDHAAGFLDLLATVHKKLHLQP
ncbi:hypothetical protein ACHHYP_01764 [Achlya hypogyna]|uniref:Uncharacterized protein n=1 Tax=Achlya hypogyna TaxID=1202772 RepID=A0A1V9ZT81_ACHHY|nr:hypothetical protein ACHHYP_01764 [Achlya hypogyna]